MPIRYPYPIEGEWEEPMQRAIQELVNIGSVPIPYYCQQPIYGLIDIDSSGKYYQKYLAKLRTSKIIKYSILRISCRVPSDPLPHCNEDGKILGHDIGLNYAVLEDALFKRASDLVVISNLSIPGSLGIDSPATFIDGHFYSTNHSIMPDTIRMARESSERIGWPVIHSIPLTTTMQWLSSPEWLLDKSGGTPLLRALSAFTYLLSDQLDVDVLAIMHALMGIEALYANGKEESIGEQIFKKAQLFLGEGIGVKKRIKSMYNFRSRVVHGEVDFPPRFMDMHDKQRRDVDDTIDIAVAILLATLQKMIVSNIKTLTFEYALRELGKD